MEQRWIPVSERLPEEAYGCLVTVMDCEPYSMEDYEYPDEDACGDWEEWLRAESEG